MVSSLDIFFMDNFSTWWWCLASMRLLGLLRATQPYAVSKVSELSSYVSSPEIKFGLADAIKFTFVDTEIAQHLWSTGQNAKYIDIDGIRMDTDSSMATIRASQNGPYITLKFEETKTQRSTIWSSHSSKKCYHSTMKLIGIRRKYPRPWIKKMTNNQAYRTFAESLVQMGGEVALKNYRQKDLVLSGKQTTPTSPNRHQIERTMREMIGVNFLITPSLVKKYGGDLDEETPTWILDPLDGTTNFAHRLRRCFVLWQHCRLVAKSSPAPCHIQLKISWSAPKNGGATVNGAPFPQHLHSKQLDSVILLLDSGKSGTGPAPILFASWLSWTPVSLIISKILAAW